MKHKVRFIPYCLTVFLLVFTTLSWGGQVVTDEVRQWARGVVSQEKALETIKAQNTLSVLYFHNKTGQTGLDPVQKGMALMLITDLSSLEGIQVVERIKIQALTEELGLGVSGLVDAGTAPRVGRLLGAKWLVGGDISTEKLTQIEVRSDLLDVPSTKILGQPSAAGELSDLFRIEKDILFEIIGLLKIELTPEQEAALKKPCSTRIKALILYFRGIDASDRGDYEKAADFYSAALEEDPGICGAGGDLRELQVLGLVSENKRVSELLRSLRDRSSLTDTLTPEDTIKRKGSPVDTPTPVQIDIRFR